MSEKDLAFTPAWQLKNLLKAKEVSPVELTDLYLRRIEELNPKLNAFITVTADLALAQAKDAERKLARGDSEGLLLGIPICIKDLEITKDIRTTIGSRVFENTVPQQDSVVVERIRKSGAIILGKTNTPEFGLSGTNENLLGDACRNPWNLDRTSGGSSGGSAAALAAGLSPIATATDGGGSIRIPASFCGLYGIKPTLGRVPRVGGLGRPSPNLTSQSGPITRDVTDAALLLQVMAGYDYRDDIAIREDHTDYLAAMEQVAKRMRVAWSPDLGYAAVDPEVAQLSKKGVEVFQELGCEVEEAGLTLEYPMPSFLDIFSTNAYASYGHLYHEYGELLTDYAKQSLHRGSEVTGADYARAILATQRMRAQVDTVMEKYDLLVTPTMAVSAFPVEQFPEVIAGQEVNPRWDYLPFTPVFNLTGHPAASIPCGFSDDGMPIGLHIIGKRGAETAVLQASAAFEKARPWAQLRPAVS